MWGFLNIGAKRWRNHAVLALGTLFAILLAHFYAPTSSLIYKITIGTAYESLLLMIIVLCIGTYQRLRTKRRLPVNIMLRRDMGIWAGITALVHTCFGFTVHMDGDILRYFFALHSDGSLSLLGNNFGKANDVGLIAALLLLFLLIISNDWTMIRLRGPRWKWLMRLNYLAFLLVILHTVLYQDVSRREIIFGYMTLLLFMLTLLVQLVGFFAHFHSKKPQEA
jgi:methionine sulfoxide reductase heme-binding subunit